MATLTTQQRFDLRASWGRDLSLRREAFHLSKADLDEAVAAIDQWVEDNAASYNQALPLAARTALTAGQKAELLLLVLRKRFTG